MDREINPDVRRKQMRLRAAVMVIVAALVVFFCMAAMRWLRPSVRRSELQFARVSRGSVDATLQASGTVVSRYETVLASPVEARVLRIDRQAGDRLHAGDEILTLDTSATRLDLSRLDDAVAQKESELAETRLKVEDGDAAARSLIEQKELDARILALKAEENVRMHAEGLVSVQDELVATTAKKKSDIELAQLRDGASRARRTGEAQIAGASLQLRTAREERDQAKQQLALAMTRSERDGILTWVVPEVGAMVKRGDVLARVADLSAYRVLATISDVHAARLAAGMPVRVKVSDDTTIDGTIASVDPRIESGVAKFYVDLAEPAHAKLRNNLRVDVFAVTASRPHTLRVHRGAVGQVEHEQVFLVRGDSLVRVPVHWGLAADDFIEPLSGLAEGDEIVISNMNDYDGVRTLRLK